MNNPEKNKIDIHSLKKDHKEFIKHNKVILSKYNKDLEVISAKEGTAKDYLNNLQH